MNPNYEWFLEQNLERFSGQWIIILGKKVVANGTAEKIKEIFVSIKREYPDSEPLLVKVPEKVMQIV